MVASCFQQPIIFGCGLKFLIEKKLSFSESNSEKGTRRERSVKESCTKYDFSTFLFCRHHSYKKVEGKIELSEIGPRFEMKGIPLDCLNLYSPPPVNTLSK